MQYAWGITDHGKTRKTNEDYYIVDDELQLYIVCDGLGGHCFGEIASKQAALAVQRFISQHNEVLSQLDNLPNWKLINTLNDLVVDAILHACKSVYDLSQESDDTKYLSTTLTLLLLTANKGVMGHVGDSRLYMMRKNKIHQLSEDHTVINEMLRNGSIKPENVSNSPLTNVLTRSIGSDKAMPVDTLIFDVLDSDVYILCTDGLHGYLDSVTTLTDLFAHQPIATLPENLVQFANNCGGKDNITAIIVKTTESQSSSSIKIKEVELQFDALARVALFNGLEMDDLLHLMNMFELETYPTGTVITKHNEPGDKLFVIISGEVILRRGDHILDRLTFGDHFGEVVLVTDAPRTATAITTQETKLLELTKTRFQWILDHRYRVASKLLFALAKELGNRLIDRIKDVK